MSRALLHPDFGTTCLLGADPNWTEAERQDMAARDRAQRMADALGEYSRHRQAALVASRDGDEYSARASRAMATASLHMHRDLLAMVER